VKLCSKCPNWEESVKMWEISIKQDFYEYESRINQTEQMITWTEPLKYKNTQFLRKQMYHELLRWIIFK